MKETAEANFHKTSWRRAVLTEGSTIGDVIRNLDETALKIVLIVAPSGQLQGTISDGDVRRGLLRGLTLHSPIDQITHRNPLVVTPGVSRDLLIQLMHANRIQQVPIVNAERHVVGLHLWDQIADPVQRENAMVIMAGGMGTRLRPQTKNCPKPMLPVSGKPILEHIVLRARSQGFQDFVFAINYLGHIVEEYFENGAKWDIRIEYLRESEPLGTAGALSLLSTRPKHPIIVTNGDVLADIDYGELVNFHCRHEAAATMAVSEYKWQNPFGVIETNGIEIVGIEEKPIASSHVNAGVYVLSPDSLSLLAKNQYCDMPSLFNQLKDAGDRTVAYPMHEPWLDIGRPDDLSRAQAVDTGKSM